MVISAEPGVRSGTVQSQVDVHITDEGSPRLGKILLRFGGLSVILVQRPVMASLGVLTSFVAGRTS